MFEIMVMPLTRLWSEIAGYGEGLEEALTNLQQLLSKENDGEITWEEPFDPSDEVEADIVDPVAIYALRAAASWLEFHEDLDGLELSDQPWEHEIFDKLEEKGHADRYPHLLHTDQSDIAAYVPGDFPNVFLFEEEDDEAFTFSIGALAGLRRELDELREKLGLEAGLEEHIDDIVFDVNTDPLADPRHGWLVLSTRLNEALRRQLPLLMLLELGEDEDDEDLEEEEISDSNLQN